MTIAGVLRIILWFDIVAFALLGLAYLRQRHMSVSQYLAWGIVALCVPVLGPFLVICQRPGQPHPDPFPSRALRLTMRAHLRDAMAQLPQARARVVRWARNRSQTHHSLY